MTKQIVILATLLSTCAIGQLMSMENTEATCNDPRHMDDRAFLTFLNDNNQSGNKGSLTFYVSPKRRIKAYNATNGMEYYEKPSKFKGKDILDAVPLETQDRKALKKAFKHAAKENEASCAKYTLEQKKFIASIWPMLTNKKKTSFIVKVHEE